MGKEGVIPFSSLEKEVEEVDILRRENQKEDNRSDYPLESQFQFLWEEDSTDDVSKISLGFDHFHSK